MISKENELLFDIILSIFVGIFLVLMINSLFDSPRIINIYE
jgi:hypothetical protein